MNRRAVFEGLRSWAERNHYFLPLIAFVGLMAGSQLILEPAMRDTPRMPFLPWLMLAVAGVIVISTVNRWVKLLPTFVFAVILVYVGPLFSGHVYMNPSVRVPREEMVQGIAFALVAGLVLLAIQRQPLNDVRRSTAVLFVFVFAFGAFCAPQHPVAEIRAQIISLGILAVGWTVNHVLSRGRAQKRHAVR